MICLSAGRRPRSPSHPLLGGSDAFEKSFAFPDDPASRAKRPADSCRESPSAVLVRGIAGFPQSCHEKPIRSLDSMGLSSSRLVRWVGMALVTLTARARSLRVPDEEVGFVVFRSRVSPRTTSRSSFPQLSTGGDPPRLRVSLGVCAFQDFLASVTVYVPLHSSSALRAALSRPLSHWMPANFRLQSNLP